MGDTARPGSGASGAESIDLARKVGTERRARRRETISDAFLRIGARIFPVQEWAWNSVLLCPCDLAAKTGDKLEAHCDIPIKGERLVFDCDGYVLRTGRTRQQVTLLISGIGKIAQAKIDHHFAAM